MHALTGVVLTLAIALTGLAPTPAPSIGTAPASVSALASTTLDRSGWTVTASHSHPDTPAANMIDGSLATGWTSGRGQQAPAEDPQFLVLDLGSSQAFDTIELAAGAAVDDYARSYAVAVSDDGATWEPATSGTGALVDGALTISLCGESSPCAPTTARYVRIEQTSWHFVNWWTVAELNLSVEETTPDRGPAQLLDRSGWVMTATSGPLSPSNLIDGNIGTGWTTQAGQTAGQWIMLDAGAPVTFDAVDLVAGAATNEYARSATVEASDDGQNWTVVADRPGALVDGVMRISICDDVATCAPVTAQYVRVTQTSNHFVNSWTIAEFNLVIGDLAFLKPQATVRETMVAPGAAFVVDVWNLAPQEPVTASSEGSSLASTTADATGTAVVELTAPGQEGEFAFSVGGAWTEWSTTIAVLVTSDVEGTDPDPNDGASVDGIQIDEADGVISLAWDAIDGASTYEVQRSTGRYSEFTEVATVTAPEFTDTVGEQDKYSYYYRVVSIAAGGERSEPSADVSLEGALFGENMHFLSPSDDTAQLDALIAGTAAEMFPFASELSDERHTFAFKPGEYDTASIELGYYTSVYGLGETPRDTTVPLIQVHSQPADSLTNFWRSVENIGIDTGSADNWITWAVSQAAPVRRLWVNGHLHLDDFGKAASGGYLADSAVTGQTGSWSQQQYFLRNNDLGQGWYGGGWNHVFVGNENPPVESADWAAAGWEAKTVETETPAIREKPFLYIADSGDYEVFVPGLRQDAVGVSWADGDPGVGDSVPIGDFHVARPDIDTAATMNAALAAGKHLLLTPGIYEIDDTLRVDRANTVVLGLGMATLRPVGGVDGMHVADVEGVTIAGVLFDATVDGSDILLQVGADGADGDHRDNPTLLADVFTRIGGAVEGKADVSVEINSSDIIGDHFWLWRADHGATAGATGWDKNTAANGLVVNGDRVTALGLFVEHFQEHQTLWNGDDGATYFYQSELPYDPPTQADYMSRGGTVKGYASYKVSSEASGHYAVGLGVYDVFIHTNEWVVAENGIEVSPGTEVRHAAIVSFGANGGQQHVVNGIGAPVSGGLAVKSGVNSHIEPIPTVSAEVTGERVGNNYVSASVALGLAAGAGELQHRVNGAEWVSTTAPIGFGTPGAHSVEYRVVHLGGVYAPASGAVELTIAIPGSPPPATNLPTLADLTPATRDGISGPVSATPGETITVTAGKSRAGELVEGWMFSDPISLGRSLVSEQGTLRVTIPVTATLGAHRIAATDAAGAVIGWYEIDIRAAAAGVGALSITGPGAVAGLLAGAILLILLGTSAVRAHRRTKIL
jgi:hypothetical protein